MANKQEIKKKVLEELTRISGNIESVSEFQYNRTDVKFAIERAIKKTAESLLAETLGIIKKDYVDYDPHHSGYAINKIDFDLLEAELKKKWLQNSDVGS